MKNISELASLDVSGFTTLTTKVSDLISVDAILSMPENSSVFLTVGTGGGKTYFATHNLYQAAQELDLKILIFENRIVTKRQMLIEINEADTSDRITVIGYQQYEYCMEQRIPFDLDLYDIIVLDEYHHISSDAILKDAYYTYHLVEAVMQHPCRRFFMSATPRGLDKHIQELHGDEVPYWELKIPMDYSKVYLQGFSSDIQLSSIASIISSNDEKGIFFLNRTQQARSLCELYPNSMYVCSESNKTNSMTPAEVWMRNEMLQHPDHLPKQFLFATTSMDVGVNLYDPEITTVVSNIMDVEQSIQCLGRRRLNSDEMITFYLKEQPLDLIWKRCEALQRTYEKCLFLGEYDESAFIRHYGVVVEATKDSVWNRYDEATKRIYLSPVMGRFLYAQNCLSVFRDILDSGKSYLEYVQDKYGFSYPLRDFNPHDFRRELLDKNRGRIFLNASERNQFIEELKIPRSQNRSSKSVLIVNEYLEKYNLPYRFVDLGRRQINGKDCKHITELRYTGGKTGQIRK